MSNIKGGKTNAMRILDRMRIAYTSHSYENPGAPKSGMEVAADLGIDPGRILKTLVTRGQGEFYVFVIPADRELDLKKAARACGAKKLEMLPVKELFSRTGYHKGGCSPLGMKKTFLTYIDTGADRWDTVYVSAGRIGAQIELAPDALLRTVKGSYADITI